VIDFMTSLSEINSSTRQLFLLDHPAYVSMLHDWCSSCMSRNTKTPSMILRQL